MYTVFFRILTPYFTHNSQVESWDFPVHTSVESQLLGSNFNIDRRLVWMWELLSNYIKNEPANT